MTQPAKVQEPSMEEILASIRRIIADDEAKPAAAEKPASPAAARPEAPVRPSVMKDIPPSAIAPAAKQAAPKPAPPPPPAPEPVASNNQDDIDAMLASLDAATPEADIRPAQPDADVFELTDEMALPDPAPAAPFNKIEPADDIEFSERTSAKARQPAYEPPPFESGPPAQQILSRSTVSAVEFGLQFAGEYRAQQQRADAGGSGQGNAAADAEILARRQSAGTGGTDRQGRNRTGFTRALMGFTRALMPGLLRRATYRLNPLSRRRDHSSAAPDRLVRLTCGAVTAF